jgi:hypothetical protein
MDTPNIWVNGSLGLQQLLIPLAVLLACGAILPCGLIIYNIIRFKKANYEKSVMTSWLLAVIFVLIALVAVFDIIGFIIYFGENMLKDNYKLAKTLAITFVALSAAFAIAFYGVLLLFAKYIGLGIGRETINIFGELYKTSKVISIVSDIEKKVISLHIATGKRVVKRYQYSVTSMCGQCLESAVSVIGVEITKGDDKEIYIQEVQKRQEEFRQSLTRTTAERGVSSSSVSKASGASKVSAASKAKSTDKKVEETKSEDSKSE